jgi:hypothetical protein
MTWHLAFMRIPINSKQLQSTIQSTQVKTPQVNSPSMHAKSKWWCGGCIKWFFGWYGVALNGVGAPCLGGGHLPLPPTMIAIESWSKLQAPTSMLTSTSFWARVSHMAFIYWLVIIPKWRWVVPSLGGGHLLIPLNEIRFVWWRSAPNSALTWCKLKFRLEVELC